jgi:N utilization substance protein B
MTDKSTHANPNKNRTPRHRAREFALQGLYQWLLNNEPASTVVKHIRTAHGFDKADGEYFTELLNGTIAQSVELRETLAPTVDRPIAELSPIEHAVLLMGAWELKNKIEIPTAS